jgi:hypothetical protein
LWEANDLVNLACLPRARPGWLARITSALGDDRRLACGRLRHPKTAEAHYWHTAIWPTWRRDERARAVEAFAAPARTTSG